MIVIKILLAVAVVLIMAFFLRSYSSRTRALTKLLALVFTLFALAAIIFPAWTTHLANLIGVGRGADLLLYALVVLVIFMLVNDNLHRRADDKRFAKLVRHASLMEAPPPPSSPPATDFSDTP